VPHSLFRAERNSGPRVRTARRPRRARATPVHVARRARVAPLGIFAAAARAAPAPRKSGAGEQPRARFFRPAETRVRSNV